MNANLFELYFDIPIITRTYFTLSIIETALCHSKIKY